jgi:hypothetical protein
MSVKDHFAVCIREFEDYGIINDSYTTNEHEDVFQCCNRYSLFHFICRKNHYKFEANYFLGCSRCPSSLDISKMIDTNTGQKIEVSCSLLRDNVKNIDFDILINSPDLTSYQNGRYEYFYSLPSLLEQKGFKVSVQKEMENQCHMNHFDFNYIIEVETDKGKCNIIPHASNEKRRRIYLCPSLDFINDIEEAKAKLDPEFQKYSFKRDRICINTFNMDLVDYSWNVAILDNFDIIGEYLDYLEGKYGYYDEDSKIFQKGEVIKDYVRSLGRNIDVKVKAKNYNSPDIDVFMTYCSNPIFPLNFEGKEFPYDFYGISFIYDKNKGKECQLTLEGLYFDIPKAFEDYMKDSFDEKAYELDIKEIDKIVIAGTFDHCFNYLKRFLGELI